jgi:hypothetical protein
MSSKFGMPPGPPPRGVPQSAQANVDLSAAETLMCDKCQNMTFVEVLLVKKVSALISPNGKAGLAPLPVLSCNACGHINAEFVPPIFHTAPQETVAPTPAPTTGIQTSKLILEK